MKSFLLIPFLTPVKSSWTIPSNIYMYVAHLLTWCFRKFGREAKHSLSSFLDGNCCFTIFPLASGGGWGIKSNMAGSGGSRCFPIFWGEAPIVKLWRETTFHFWLVA
jgi:hypothetical protein